MGLDAKSLKDLETQCPACPGLKLLLDLLKSIREPLETAMKDMEQDEHKMDG